MTPPAHCSTSTLGSRKELNACVLTVSPTSYTHSPLSFHSTNLSNSSHHDKTKCKHLSSDSFSSFPPRCHSTVIMATQSSRQVVYTNVLGGWERFQLLGGRWGLYRTFSVVRGVLDDGKYRVYITAVCKSFEEYKLSPFDWFICQRPSQPPTSHIFIYMSASFPSFFLCNNPPTWWCFFLDLAGDEKQGGGNVAEWRAADADTDSPPLRL